MSQHPYTEDQLVEQPAIGLFAELGWQTVCAMEETFGAGGTLGLENVCCQGRSISGRTGP
jgi:type I restriction enzyme R subunit